MIRIPEDIGNIVNVVHGETVVFDRTAFLAIQDAEGIWYFRTDTGHTTPAYLRHTTGVSGWTLVDFKSSFLRGEYILL